MADFWSRIDHPAPVRCVCAMISLPFEKLAREKDLAAFDAPDGKVKVVTLDNLRVGTCAEAELHRRPKRHLRQGQDDCMGFVMVNRG